MFNYLSSRLKSLENTGVGVWNDHVFCYYVSQYVKRSGGLLNCRTVSHYDGRFIIMFEYWFPCQTVYYDSVWFVTLSDWLLLFLTVGFHARLFANCICKLYLSVGFHVRLVVTMTDRWLPCQTVRNFSWLFVTMTDCLLLYWMVCYKVKRVVKSSDCLLPGLALCYQVGRFVTRSGALLPGRTVR